MKKHVLLCSDGWLRTTEFDDDREVYSLIVMDVPAETTNQRDFRRFREGNLEIYVEGRPAARWFADAWLLAAQV